MLAIIWLLLVRCTSWAVKVLCYGIWYQLYLSSLSSHLFYNHLVKQIVTKTLAKWKSISQTYTNFKQKCKVTIWHFCFLEQGSIFETSTNLRHGFKYSTHFGHDPVMHSKHRTNAVHFALQTLLHTGTNKKSSWYKLHYIIPLPALVTNKLGYRSLSTSRRTSSHY